MSLTPIVVSVERPTRTGDGSGGKAITWATASGMSALRCTQNYYGRTSQLQRMEQAAHNAQGPGVATRTQQFFTFEQKPFPAIRIEDRIVTPDGSKFVVLWPPRVYDDSMQVDAELVA